MSSLPLHRYFLSLLFCLPVPLRSPSLLPYPAPFSPISSMQPSLHPSSHPLPCHPSPLTACFYPRHGEAIAVWHKHAAPFTRQTLTWTTCCVSCPVCNAALCYPMLCCAAPRCIELHCTVLFRVTKLSPTDANYPCSSLLFSPSLLMGRLTLQYAMCEHLFRFLQTPVVCSV